VAVIGDSITYLSAADIRTRLEADGHPVLLTGRIGFTAAQLGGDVDAFAAHKPKVVLYEMGTNDVSESETGVTDAAAYEKVVAGYLPKFPHACQIATTVSSHRPSPIMDAMATQINAWMKTHFAHVVDWNAYEWGQRQAGHVLVEPDEVHPNDAGQQALARLDQAAVRACPA
jgi:lysophospholipase L1-like esterase